MHVRIYKPSKTAMQAGRAKTRKWLLEYELQDKPTPDPIIGWNGSRDTRKQVRLSFETEQEAIAFARKHGYTFTIVPPRERKFKRKAYADNFAFSRMEPWTH